MNYLSGRWAIASLVGILLSNIVPEVNGQMLPLRDDFDQSGIVNPAVWRLPFEGEGTFVGRTQYRGDAATDMPLQGIAEPLASDGLVMELDLDTYSPIDPGNQFLGTDILTKRNFARAGGLTIEARMRLKPPTAGGLVNGFFLFDVTRGATPAGDFNSDGTVNSADYTVWRDNLGSSTALANDPQWQDGNTVGQAQYDLWKSNFGTTSNQVRDEIDWELLSNQTQGTATQDPFSNYWNDGPFVGPGSGGDPQFHDVAGVDLTQFQDYKIEWTPDHIKWFVNNNLVRTQTTNVPDDPMKLHFNIWAPDSGFTDAYNPALQPAATPGANETYQVQVDWVEVKRMNTTATEKLLDGGFETVVFPLPVPSGDPDTETGTWFGFNNAFLNQGGVPPVDGTQTLLTYGPFKGTPDASGVFQNVAATPGQEFGASVMARSPISDSIVGTENFTQLVLTFHDSDGNVIQEAFGDAANLASTNAKDVPIFDGRDPNLNSLQNEWIQYSVDAIAPAGTEFVRYNLFFIQLANQGGAVFFDQASLKLLEPVSSGTLQVATNVPEPATCVLLLGGLGAAAVLRYRRR